jgi:hypothetical protein
MADASTCELTPSHPPNPPSQKSFSSLLHTIKHALITLRHGHDKHEPKYFAAVSHLSDAQLTSFDTADLVAVRAGKVAYGVIVFGKVKIPGATASDGSQGYVFVRWFVGGADHDGDGLMEKDEVEYKFHSFYTEDKEEAGGGNTYRAIMGEKDELFFFSE